MRSALTRIASRRWFDFFAAAVVAASPAVVALLLPFPVGRIELMLVLVLAVTVAARRWGSGPGMLAAGVSLLALTTTTTPPFADLHPDAFDQWVQVVTYTGVTLFVAAQVGRLREERERAKAAETDALMISRLSALLVPDTPLESVAEETVEAVRDLTGASWVAIVGPGTNGTPVAFAQSVEEGASADLDSGAMIAYALANGVAVGLRSEEGGRVPVTGSMPPSVPHRMATGSGAKRTDIALAMVSSDGLVGGVLYVGPDPRGRAYSARIATQLVLVSRQVALFGERQRLKSEAAHAQATREAEQLRASLMSSLSHELKTPIASMGATVSGLLEERDPSPERVHEELGSVVVDLDRLDRSIGELLDLSRLETDEWRPTKDWHDLGDVVGTVVGSLVERDRSRIVIDLPEEPVLACVDFVQVSRAVHHVVENALAYSDAGERVVVSVSHQDVRSLITVTDRGPGVPASERTRIFEKFYRGGASARVPHGTGLGLAISSEIVGRHGGTVRVEAAHPRGARFVLEFPDSERPEPLVAPQPEETE